MSIKEVSDGTLVFPAKIETVGLYLASGWVLVSDQSVAIVEAPGSKTINAPIFFPRTDKPVEKTKARNNLGARLVEIEFEGEPLTIEIKDIGSCGCGHALKAVTTIAGVQKAITNYARKSVKDKERAAARLKAQKEARAKNKVKTLKREESKKANLAARQAQRKRRNPK